MKVVIKQSRRNPSSVFYCRGRLLGRRKSRVGHCVRKKLIQGGNEEKVVLLEGRIPGGILDQVSEDSIMKNAVSCPYGGPSFLERVPRNSNAGLKVLQIVFVDFFPGPRPNDVKSKRGRSRRIGEQCREVVVHFKRHTVKLIPKPIVQGERRCNFKGVLGEEVQLALAEAAQVIGCSPACAVEELRLGLFAGCAK